MEFSNNICCLIGNVVLSLAYLEDELLDLIPSDIAIGDIAKGSEVTMELRFLDDETIVDGVSRGEL